MLVDHMSEQDRKEILYISMILLICGDKPISDCWMRNSIVPEIVNVIDSDSLIALMHSFSGQRIKIPTIEEMSKAAKIVYYYYYAEIEGMTKHDSLEKVGLSATDIRWVPAKVARLKKFFMDNKFKIPDNLCFSVMMKKINEDLCKEE